MNIKTNELQGVALDWAVAECEVGKPVGSFLDGVVPHPNYNKFYPSTDWAQGGPIIEREQISVWVARHSKNAKDIWAASFSFVEDPKVLALADISYGPTPLIAAMRCYVVSQLGDEVDVPEELGERE